MGFYIRKSVSAGPFRFNLSGSGIGMSVGVKGFRIGTGPRGNYVHMGRGGLYYRASLGGGVHARQPVPAQQYPTPTSHPPTSSEQLTAIETGSVLAMAPSNGSDIVAQINEKAALLRLWPWTIGFGTIGSLCLLSLPEAQVLGVISIIITAIGTAVAARWDQSRRSVVVVYDVEDETAVRLKAFSDEFDKVATACRVWNIDTAGRTSDWKRNAGAGRLISRRGASLCYDTPGVLKTNVSVPCIKGGRQDVYFLPDVVLVVEGNHVGGLAYDQMQLFWNTTVFIETDGVPSDSKIVGYTWRFVNKNGGPDRRFNNNSQIPKVLYQQMGLQGAGGFQKILHISKVADTAGFDRAFSDLGKMVSKLQTLAIAAPQSTAANEPPPIASREKDCLSASAQNGIVIAFIVASAIASITLMSLVARPHGSAASEQQQPIQEAEQLPAIPSFDCSKVRSKVLTLVCATPELATADRQLAAAYQAALSKTRSRQRLTANQQAWIKQRNRSKADVTLLAQMYQRRIEYLQSIPRQRPLAKSQQGERKSGADF